MFASTDMLWSKVRYCTKALDNNTYDEIICNGLQLRTDFYSGEPQGGGGGGTPIYGLYRYVPRNRVWVLRFSVLK